jgi:hypothetical protein
MAPAPPWPKGAARYSGGLGYGDGRRRKEGHIPQVLGAPGWRTAASTSVVAGVCAALGGLVRADRQKRKGIGVDRLGLRWEPVGK